MAAVDFTAAKLLSPQLRGLQDSGYHVRIACGRTSTDYWGELSTFDPIDLQFPRKLDPWAMMDRSRRLRQHVAEWRPDILHLHTPAASLPVRALPRRVWPRNTRIVYTVHGYLHPWPPVGARDKLIQRLEAWESSRCDLTLFQSQEDLDCAQALGYAGSPTYLGNGVEDEWFDIAPKCRQKSEPLHVLFVGRLVREKGVLDLAKAVSQTRGVVLHLAGEALPSDRDSVSAELESMSRGVLAGRMHLHGMLSRGGLQRLYRDMDVLCLPSYREGVPRSVIEGLAAGRPVVATRIRGNRELVQDRVNGFLYPPGDVRALSGLLRQLVSLGEEDVAALGVQARRSADPRLRETAVFDRLAEAYSQVLQQGGTSPNRQGVDY